MERSEACAALTALAEQELALVDAEAYDELATLHARRVELIDALGEPGEHGPLSSEDREQLRHAARVQQLAGEAMRQHRDGLRRRLGHSGHARRAAAGYRASATL